MAFLRALITTFLLFQSIQALPKAANALAVASTVHEKRSQPLANVFNKERLDPNAIVPFRFALAENTDYAHEHLYLISDPDSPSFGQHWTVEQIHEHFSPKAEVVEAVKSWLENAGIQRESIEESASKAWLSVPIAIKNAEALFETEFFNLDGGIGCDQYSLPIHLTGHIDFIEPGIAAMLPSGYGKKLRTGARSSSTAQLVEKRSTSTANVTTSLTTCDVNLTPACIRALYDIPLATLNQEENILGVFEYNSIFDQEDLNSFFHNYAPQIPNGTNPVQVSINGAQTETTPKKSGIEAIVDLEMIYSLIYPQNITLYQSQGTKEQLLSWAKELNASKEVEERYLDYRGAFQPFLDAVDGKFCTAKDRENQAECGTVTLPRVVTFSYEIPELSLPERIMQRACNAFMKLSLMGTTLLFSSGDYGVSAIMPVYGGNQCINAKDIDAYFSNGTVFSPNFPSVCPFVTSVGATQLDKDQTVNDSESCMFLPNESPTPWLANFSSSGGRSNYFQTPLYQASTVESYFAKYDYPSYEYTGRSSVGANGGVYSRSGRAFPDVSANGAWFPSFQDGQYSPTFGTSLATPLWASIITMINQERTLCGKGPVGFINPTLYKHPEVFHDIVKGSAPGCNTPGWASADGWDATTGLGTPNYPALLKVFMDLP